MNEWGLFSDEGLVEGEFSSREEAEYALATRYSPDDGLYVDEVELVVDDDEESEGDGE